MSKTKEVSEKFHELTSWKGLLSRLLCEVKAGAGTLTATERKAGNLTLYCLQSMGRDIICLTPGYKLCDGYTSKIDTFRIHCGPNGSTSSPMDGVKANTILSLYAAIKGDENVMFWPITEQHVRTVKVPSQEDWCKTTEIQIDLIEHQIKMEKQNNFIALTFLKEQAERVGVHVHFERTDIDAARNKTLELLHRKADRLYYGLPPLARALVFIDDALCNGDDLIERGNEWIWGYINYRLGGKSFISSGMEHVENRAKIYGRSRRSPYTWSAIVAFHTEILNLTRTIDTVEVKVALKAIMDLMEIRQRIRKVSSKNPGENCEALAVAIQKFRQKGKGV